jgi:hypothetical protein
VVAIEYGAGGVVDLDSEEREPAGEGESVLAAPAIDLVDGRPFEVAADEHARCRERDGGYAFRVHRRIRDLCIEAVDRHHVPLGLESEVVVEIEIRVRLRAAIVQRGLQADTRRHRVLQPRGGPGHPARARGVLRAVERLPAAVHIDEGAIGPQRNGAARLILLVEEAAPHRERRLGVEPRHLLGEERDRVPLILVPLPIGIETGERPEERWLARFVPLR